MKLQYDELFETTMEILVNCGESEENAAIVADSMIKSDARGIVTHGTYLLTPIRKRVQANQLSLPTKIMVVKDEGAVAVIDGGDGLGAVAGMSAAKIAIKKAKEFGTGTVLIRNTNNIGSLSYFTETAAKEGMVAIMSCNAASAVAPWGGAEVFMGTNPIAIAIYTGRDSMFSADMATSIVARGKIRKAARNGDIIPKDWAIDCDGNFTTDPNRALDGALLPMGGPKGSAISLAIDIIAGMLSGAQYAPSLKSFHELKGKTGVGASFTALDISRFMDLEVFKQLIEGYIKNVKGMKKAKGFSEIRIPGENKYRMEKKSILEGIELDDNAVKSINLLLNDVGSDRRL